ncbi:MAG: RidA family protein [Desulfatibacillaceae bacterium]
MSDKGNRVIQTTNAPAAIGPYSQAVRAGDFVFVSGQLGMDPETGELVNGDIRDRTRRAIENVAAIAQAAGGTLADVVQVRLYLLEMGHFASVNEVYAEYFGQGMPARAAIGVASLPRGADVEMEAVLYLPA